MFCEKKVFLKFHKFHRKTLVLESLFNKVAGLKVWKFIKKRLQHKCFPVKFMKFSRTPIFINICERLLLINWTSTFISKCKLKEEFSICLWVFGISSPRHPGAHIQPSAPQKFLTSSTSSYLKSSHCDYGLWVNGLFKYGLYNLLMSHLHVLKKQHYCLMCT